MHLAPALAAKALRPRWTGLVPFALAQVLMDTEPVVRLVLGASRLHGPIHSLVGAVVVGCACTSASRLMKVSWQSALVGGLFGTVSHVALDAIVHPDVPLFWPWTGNPLYLSWAFWPMHYFLAAVILLAVLLWVLLK